MVDHLYFVHGTGVREAGYQQTKQDLADNLAHYGLGIPVSGRSWGVELGVRVSDAWIAGMTPPTAAKGLAPSDPEIDAALWAQLMDDPLFELRLMTVVSATPEENENPSQVLPSTAILVRLRALNLPTPVGGVSTQKLAQAAGSLADDDGYRETVATAAARAGEANQPALVAALARATVALALVRTRGEPGTGPDALYLTEMRDQLVEQVSRALNEGEKGLIPDWILDPLKQWAEARATAYGVDRRTGLMNAVSPGMGDIVYSQRRGDDIIEALRSDIAALPGSVAVLGHSLGGEHLVNLLVENRPSNVTKLVTVASQLGYFAACDSMRNLRLPLKPGSRDPVDPRMPLPEDFPAWCNFYNRNDFLSFRAATCFQGPAGVKDVEIISSVPFPDSHGAYFRTPAFYRELVAWLNLP